jgi:hypothetical protein
VQDVVPLPEAMATLPFSEKTQDGDTLTLRVATGHAVVVSAACCVLRLYRCSFLGRERTTAVEQWLSASSKPPPSSNGCLRLADY